MAATRAKKPPTPTAPATAPASTISTMVICVPEQVPTEVLRDSRQLDRHFGVNAMVWPRLWAKPLHVWHRRQMVALHKGRPAYCAGGPVRLLDLSAVRWAAGMAAGVRYQWWSRVVHGTPTATAWPTFLQRHHTDPAKLPLDQARQLFDDQPRVLAMRMHNAAAYGAGALDPLELEMLQAGCTAYQHYHALSAVTRDALLTPDGRQMRPASDTFADRVTYLDATIRYLDGLDDAQRILVVSL